MASKSSPDETVSAQMKHEAKLRWTSSSAQLETNSNSNSNSSSSNCSWKIAVHFINKVEWQGRGRGPQLHECHEWSAVNNGKQLDWTAYRIELAHEAGGGRGGIATATSCPLFGCAAAVLRGCCWGWDFGQQQDKINVTFAPHPGRVLWAGATLSWEPRATAAAAALQ